MLDNIFLSLFILFTQVMCIDNEHSIEVNKLLSRKGFNSKDIDNKLIQYRRYNKDHKLSYSVSYSRVGCNAVDSSYYKYDIRGNLTNLKVYNAEESQGHCKSSFYLDKEVGYFYDKKGMLLNKKALKGEDIQGEYVPYVNSFSNLKIIDSLNLLEEYLNEDAFIFDASSTENKSIYNISATSIRVKVNINDIPYSFLTEYSIPQTQFLNYMELYVNSGYITKEEFNFKEYLLTRSYIYKNGIIEKVITETSDLNSNKKSISTEVFTINEISKF